MSQPLVLETLDDSIGPDVKSLIDNLLSEDVEMLLDEENLNRDDAIAGWKETTVKLKRLAINQVHLQVEKDAFYERLNEVKGDLYALQGYYSTIEDANANLKEDIREAEETIVELKEARDEAVDQRQATGDKLRYFRGDNGGLRETNKLLENQLNDADSRCKSLEAKLFDLLSFNKNSLTEGQQNKEERDKLQEQFQDANGQISDLELENRLVNAKRAAAETERDELVDKVKTMDHMGERSDEQLQAALEKVGMLEAKLQLAQSMPRKSEVQSRGLDFGEPAVVDPNHKVDSLLKELSKAKTENARVQGDLQMVLERDLSDLKAVHSSMQGGIKEANDGLGLLEGGIDDIKQLQEKIGDLETNKKTQTDQNQALEKELDHTKLNLHIVMGEIENMSAEVDTLGQEFLETKKEKDKLQAHLDYANQQLGTTRGLQDSHNNLQVTLTKLELLNEEQQNRIKELEVDATRALQESQAQGAREVDKDLKTSAELQAIKTECGDLKAILSERDFQLQESQFAQKKTEGVIHRHGRKIKLLEIDLKEARDENETLDDAKAESDRKHSVETRALKSQRDSLNADLDQVNVELKKSQALLEKAEILADTQRRRIAELEKQLNERDDVLNKKMERERDSVGKERALGFERSDLKSRLEALTAREVSLGSELSDLETSALGAAKESRKKLDLLRGDLFSAEQVTQEAIRARDIVNTELDNANQSISRLQADIDELSQQRKARSSELEMMREDFESIKKENSGLTSRVSNLEGQKGEFDKLKALQNQYEKLKSAQQDMNFSSRSAAKDTEDLSRKLGARDAEVDSLSKQLRERNSMHEDLKDEQRHLRRAHQGVVKASRDAAVALSKQLDERKTDIENLKLKLRKNGSEHLSAKEKVLQLGDESKKNQLSLKEVQNELDDATKEVKSLKIDLERKVLQGEELVTLKDSLQDSLEAAEALVGTLRHRLRSEGEAKNKNTERLSRDLMRAEKQLREHGSQLDDAKKKVRDMALERRSLNERNQNVSDALKSKIALLEERFGGTRQAYAEANKSKNKAEAEVTGLRAAIASHENHSKSLERKGKIATERESEQTKFLEEAVSALELQCEDLEYKLASTTAERDETRKELGHARGKLRETISTISTLKAACSDSETDLSAITPALVELLQSVSKSGDMAMKVTHNDPAYLVEKLKVACSRVIQGRDEAIGTRNELEQVVTDAKAISDGLVTTVAEQEGSLAELQEIHRQDKKKLMAELKDLGGAVDQASNNSTDAIMQLRLQVREGKDQMKTLVNDLEASIENHRALGVTNKALEKSVTESLAAQAILKQEAENAANEHADARAVNVSLQRSLDTAMSAESKTDDSDNDAVSVKAEKTRRMENDGFHARRVEALELSLAEKDKRLREGIEETRVLREDALKLKVFLEAALEEAKELLYLLLEAKRTLGPSRLGDDASSKRVFARLENMVNNISKEVDGLSKASVQSGDMDAASPNARNPRKTAGTTPVDPSLPELSSSNPKSSAPTERNTAERRHASASTRLANGESLGFGEPTNRGQREAVPLSYPAKQINSTVDEQQRHPDGAENSTRLRRDLDKMLSGASTRGRPDFGGTIPTADYLHPGRNADSWLPVHAHTNPWKPGRTLRGSPEQDAYVQERLAKSAASRTALGAPSNPYRSVEELMTPVSVGMLGAGILGPRRNSLAAPFVNMAGSRSNPRVISDPEVFNSPFIRSSESTFPQRTPVVLPGEKLGRPSSSYRRPLKVEYASLAGAAATTSTLLNQRPYRCEEPFQRATSIPNKVVYKAPSQERVPRPVMHSREMAKVRNIVDPPLSRRSVDANSSFDSDDEDALRERDGRARLNEARWAASALV